MELWGNRGEGDTGISRKEIGLVKEVCEPAPFVSFHASPDHWSWDPKGLEEEIALAQAVSARTLVLHKESLGLVAPSSRPDLPAIRRLAEAARTVGVLLALENGRDSVWALDFILDALGDDPGKTNIGICIDLGHAHISQDAGRQPIRNYLERYRGQLVHLHLHDNVDGRDDHLPPGRGSIDWEAALEAIESVGYRGPAVFEIHSDRDLLSVISQARRYLFRIAGAV